MRTDLELVVRLAREEGAVTEVGFPVKAEVEGAAAAVTMGTTG
jgi:hypothetical protein